MTGIYPLPENPTSADIIRRSIVAHPSLFREALINQAAIHDDYSQLTINARAAQGADASKLACLRAYDFVGCDNLTDDERAAEICKDCGTMVVALNVACKLQCLPAHIRTAAAVSWEDSK